MKWSVWYVEPLELVVADLVLPEVRNVGGLGCDRHSEAPRTPRPPSPGAECRTRCGCSCQFSLQGFRPARSARGPGCAASRDLTAALVTLAIRGSTHRPSKGCALEYRSKTNGNRPAKRGCRRTLSCVARPRQVYFVGGPRPRNIPTADAGLIQWVSVSPMFRRRQPADADAFGAEVLTLPRAAVRDGSEADPEPGRCRRSGAGHARQGVPLFGQVRARHEPESLAVDDPAQHVEESGPRRGSGSGRSRQHPPRRGRSGGRWCIAEARRPSNSCSVHARRGPPRRTRRVAGVFRQAVWMRDVEEFSYAEIAEDARCADRNGDVAHFARATAVARLSCGSDARATA